MQKQTYRVQILQQVVLADDLDVLLSSFEPTHLADSPGNTYSLIIY